MLNPNVKKFIKRPSGIIPTPTMAPQGAPEIKVTANLGLGARERLPINDPELDDLYEGQKVNHIPRKPKPPVAIPQPAEGEPIHPYLLQQMAKAQQVQPTEVAGIFAEPMSAEDISNLSTRKKRVPHKFLKKAKVCVNCKWFHHYVRGKDKERIAECTYLGGSPWDKSWTCSYSVCEDFVDKEDGSTIPKVETSTDD